MEKVPPSKRTARFRCVLAVTRLLFSGMTKRVLPTSVQQPMLFEGVCEGQIALAPAGEGGFGYDPLFIPHGHKESFGQLGDAVKNQLSHRARALEQLKAFLDLHEAPQ